MLRTCQGLPWSAERCPVFLDTVLDFHSKLGGLGAGRQNGDLSPGSSEQGCGYARVSSVRATQACPVGWPLPSWESGWLGSPSVQFLVPLQGLAT